MDGAALVTSCQQMLASTLLHCFRLVPGGLLQPLRFREEASDVHTNFDGVSQSFKLYGFLKRHGVKR